MKINGGVRQCRDRERSEKRKEKGKRSKRVREKD